MKLYDKVRKLLETEPELRDSDRKLIWKVWCDEGSLQSWDENRITYQLFMRATSPDNITRAKRKVVEDHPELQSSKKVLEAKKDKEATGGKFVYQEPFNGKLF